MSLYLHYLFNFISKIVSESEVFATDEKRAASDRSKQHFKGYPYGLLFGCMLKTSSLKIAFRLRGEPYLLPVLGSGPVE